MAKGPIITGQVKKLIVEVYLEHPHWRAKEVQYEVNRKLGSDSPRLSAVQKELTKIRKRVSEEPPEQKELDHTWSVGTLVKYPIAPEAVPVLLQMQNRRRERALQMLQRVEYTISPEDISTKLTRIIEKELGGDLTIREARWIARLYAATEDADMLDLWARNYAHLEKVSQISGTAVDTHEFDYYFGEISPMIATMVLLSDRDLLTDTEGKEWVKEIADKYETEALGLSLDEIDFTIKGWVTYTRWLSVLIGYKKMQNLSRESRKKIVLSLREWTKENEPNFTSYFHLAPIEIIRKLEPDLADRLKKRGLKFFIKEVQNERPHTSKG